MTTNRETADDTEHSNPTAINGTDSTHKIERERGSITETPSTMQHGLGTLYRGEERGHTLQWLANDTLSVTNRECTLREAAHSTEQTQILQVNRKPQRQKRGINIMSKYPFPLRLLFFYFQFWNRDCQRTMHCALSVMSANTESVAINMSMTAPCC